MSFVKENELADFIESKRSTIRKLVIKDVLINYAKILKDTILTRRQLNHQLGTIRSHIQNYWQMIQKIIQQIRWVHNNFQLLDLI